jgi:peptide/nickel transport system permease protein
VIDWSAKYALVARPKISDYTSRKHQSAVLFGAMMFRRLFKNRVVRKLCQNRSAMVALGFLAALVALALFGPFFTKDPDLQDLAGRLAQPSVQHWLGTDQFGRDLFSRLVAASRVTALAVAQGVGIAVVIGIPLGVITGYAGGWVDGFISRAADALLALPPLMLALAIVGVLGRGLTNAMIAVGVVLAPRFLRVTRAAVLSVSREGYVEAAVADGCSPGRVLLRHILPNASGPLLVQVSFGVGVVISAEASLSFLGLGVQAPQASWGSLIRQSFDIVYQDAFPLFPPTLLVAATVWAVFAIGDGLRDAFQGVGRHGRV